MSVRFILCDIEGTTTSISFVHKVLFPIASQQMSAFIGDNWGSDLVSSEVAKVVSEHPQVENTAQGISDYFLDLIKQDKKDTTLKSIQGKIWQQAYDTGKVKGHIYADVLPAWQEWIKQGKQIYIYSSGSVKAQKLIFGFSEQGDLTQYLSGYFDTNVGGKKDSASYQAILQELGAEAQEVLFLSDVPAELEAAQAAGMQVVQLKRADNEAFEASDFRTVTTFAELESI